MGKHKVVSAALFGLVVVAAVFLLPLPGTLGAASDAMLISHSTHVSHSTTAVGSRYCSTTVSVPTSLSYNTEPLRTMLGLPTSFSFGSSFVTSTLAPSNLTHVLVTFVAGSDAFISVVPSGSTLQLWKWYSGSPPALLQVLQTPSYQKTVGLSSIGYGEYTGTTSLTLELYEIPLKTIGGGGGGGGPVIIFASYSASWAVGAYTVASASGRLLLCQLRSGRQWAVSKRRFVRCWSWMGGVHGERAHRRCWNFGCICPTKLGRRLRRLSSDHRNFSLA